MSKYIVYHGTNSKFNMFSTEFTGKGNDQLGSGFYFADNIETAQMYGDNILKCEITINNPIILNTNHSNLASINLNLKSADVARIIKLAPDIYNIDETPLWDWQNISGYTKEDLNYLIEDIAEKYDNLLSLEHDFFRWDATKFREAVNKVLGYDGVIQQFDKNKFYVCWFPEQIKVLNMITEDIISLDKFKDDKTLANFKDFINTLIEYGNIANPSNPYQWIADKCKMMSEWNKKDWEVIFKKELTFKEVRDAQVAFGDLANKAQEIADSYTNYNKKLNEAGYDWNKGMSNNAVNAYNNGEMPLSKWTKSLILDTFNNKLNNIDDYTKNLYSDVLKNTSKLLNNLKKLPLKDLKNLLLTKSSWHHTSKYYNITDFYEVDIEYALDNIYQNAQYLYINEDYNDKYYNKQKYVDKLMTQNAEIDTLTKEQYEVLKELASFRHKFHVSFDSIFYENSNIYHEIDNGDYSPLNNKLEEVELPVINWSVDIMDIPTFSWIDIDFNKTEDDFNTYEEYLEAKEAFRVKLYEECYSLLEKLNQDIEKYLKDIDKKYGTSYAPTGFSRFKESLNEAIEEIDDDIYITKSAYTVRDFIQNKPKDYRIVYDDNIKYYIIGNANKYIHSQLMEAAMKTGLYAGWWMENDYDLETYIEDKLDNSTLSWLYFTPNLNELIDQDRSNDMYLTKLNYDFGVLYLQYNVIMEDLELLDILGKPNKLEFLECD